MSNYLKSFTIGTSWPVWIQHLSALALKDKSYYDYSFETYSVILPIYYGLMGMLALYLRERYNLSLERSLFTTSCISIIFVVMLNYFVSRKKFKPYKKYTNREWLEYILRNGARHLIAFNLIMYYTEKNFSTFPNLKIFIIGSSLFSYLMTFLKIQNLKKKGHVNYDYRLFAVFEPLLQGLYLLISLSVLKNFSLEKSMFILALVGAIGWYILARTFKTYNYDCDEWDEAFIRVLITSIKFVGIYYLLLNL